MNKEETRYFKLYSNRTNATTSRKDIQLFDYIRKHGFDYNEDKIIKKLYPNSSKNAFYRLKNRLAEDVNKSLSLQHCMEDELLQVNHFLTLQHLYFIKGKYKLSQYYLKKAEKHAKIIESYELLDVIYGEYIKLSHEILSIDPGAYIEKRSKNSEELTRIRQIDDVLAVLSYKLKTTQNFSLRENPVVNVLEKTVNSLIKDENVKAGSKLRFKIYRAVSQILLQRHDYIVFEDYLLKTFDEFTKEELFNKSNHDTKLQMLTYLVNTLFTNKKYQESLRYADLLKESMEMHDNFLEKKYKFFYYSGLINNYNTLDKDKSIELLLELQESDWLKNTPYYELFVYANLCLNYFDKGEYKKAIKNMHQMYVLDSFENTDDSFKFKSAIAELIIRYELKDFDYLEYRMKQVVKDFKHLLSIDHNIREATMIDIIGKMMITQNIRVNKELKSIIIQFIQTNSKKGTEVIDYNEWLNSKIA